MLASMRHFLRFIDLDRTFDEYGFTKKVRFVSLCPFYACVLWVRKMESARAVVVATHQDVIPNTLAFVLSGMK